MTSRSRLGKGLGALFPALPGEDDETPTDTSQQQGYNEPNSGNKRPALQELDTESNGQKRSATSSTVRDKAKQERSIIHSDHASSQQVASADSSKSRRKRSNNAKQKRVSIPRSLNGDVSRET